MNLTELKQAIENLDGYWGMDIAGNQAGCVEAQDVLSLLSQVTLEDELAEMRCEECESWTKEIPDKFGYDIFWMECSNINVAGKIDSSIVKDCFGCKHFKKKEG